MKGYIVANVDVTDADAYEPYKAQVHAIIARYGGRYLVRGGAIEVREGEPGLSRLVILDSSGKGLTSQAFAGHLAEWRDGGVRDAAFIIGGPDGLAKTAIDRANLVLPFGVMTWPHQLARIMLVEQIYRAVTILTGHPYHRE